MNLVVCWIMMIRPLSSSKPCSSSIARVSFSKSSTGGLGHSSSCKVSSTKQNGHGMVPMGLEMVSGSPYLIGRVIFSRMLTCYCQVWMSVDWRRIPWIRSILLLTDIHGECAPSLMDWLAVATSSTQAHYWIVLKWQCHPRVTLAWLADIWTFVIIGILL